MTRGRFITLEGGEGAGKSTAATVIREWLERQGRSVVCTREPGGTPLAERIREVLLDPATGNLDPISELLLMFVSRRENVVRVIEPALAAGHDVICDRFTDASAAYQGGGRGIGPEMVQHLAELVHPGLRPDLTLLLDLPVETGLERIRATGNAPDRFESGHVEFLKQVRATYLEIARREPDRFAVIDAGRPAEAVAEAIITALETRLG